MHADWFKIVFLQLGRNTGHFSGQRPVLTGQEASLVGQKYKSVRRN